LQAFEKVKSSAVLPPLDFQQPGMFWIYENKALAASGTWSEDHVPLVATQPGHRSGTQRVG
jgi:hypothetical protein